MDVGEDNVNCIVNSLEKIGIMEQVIGNRGATLLMGFSFRTLVWRNEG